MGVDFQKLGGNLIDPFRIVSSATKALTGHSGEQILGIGQRSSLMGAKPSESAIPKLPDAPVGGATAAEKARIRKKTKTILTSPLVGDEYGGAPTLLGTGDTTKKNTLG